MGNGSNHAQRMISCTLCLNRKTYSNPQLFFFFLKSNIESLTVVCIIFFQRHNFPLTFHSASIRYFSLQKLPIKKQTKQTKASFEPLF